MKQKMKQNMCRIQMDPNIKQTYGAKNEAKHAEIPKHEANVRSIVKVISIQTSVI